MLDRRLQASVLFLHVGNTDQCRLLIESKSQHATEAAIAFLQVDVDVLFCARQTFRI